VQCTDERRAGLCSTCNDFETKSFISKSYTTGGFIMTKTKIGVAVLATAAAGSVALGGIALAGVGNAGGSGTGGAATNNCLNVGLDLISGLGVAGTGTATGASCAASANGAGGSAY